LDRRRNTTAPPLELRALEKLRVEQAGELQGVTLPWASLRAGGVMLGHECQSMADFLDYFQPTDGRIGRRFRPGAAGRAVHLGS